MKQQLKNSLKKNAIIVPVLIGPLTEQIIIAEKLFIEIHQQSGLSQTEFQTYLNEYVNSSKHRNQTYQRNLLVDSIIENVSYPGKFKIYEYEAIGNKPWIHLNKLNLK